jgi:PAS domain S-box-containing protein
MRTRRKERAPLPDPISPIYSPVENLDLATVLKISQTVSGETVLETLIDKLMRIAIEHAGAERGVLILRRGVEQRIEAEALTRDDAVVVRFRGASLPGAALPESIVHHVVHTRESVILDDVTAHNPFSADAYIAEHHTRSVLCLPLIKQATLIGALYLENNLMPNVFAPTRVAVLQLLASQAAISLENTRLYADLEEREGKIRRLFDANIMGIFHWNLDGEIIEANGAFLQMVQYQREDLGLGYVRWTDLTPPEWRDRSNQALAELKSTGTAKPFEKEYFRKDGSRVPVLVGSAAFGGREDEGVAFVIDLTERKRAEAEARASDRRCREIRAELEHANRVARMGHLSASIAHEVNQPIGATLINAQTALRLLARRPSDVERATQAINRIVNDAKRAADILSRTRELVKKAPVRREDIEINKAILEVIGLTRGEMSRNGVLLRKHLEEDLPLIQGDRVQIQQVMLNLIVNAIEAMGQMADGRRELVITTRTEADGVLVGVRDSGPGLSGLALERAFEAFYTSKTNGLGMGLSICRSIIEAHGGRLWASANLPQGAVFQFTMRASCEQ